MVKVFKLLIVFLFYISYAWAQPLRLTSPSGKYVAEPVVFGTNNLHYLVIDMSNRQTRIQTNAQYSTPNDVKAGMFSPDSRYFAAAYHYGHEGNYTWVGIWDILTNSFVQAKTKPGWIRDLSWVFTPQQRPPIADQGSIRSKARENVSISSSPVRPECERAVGYIGDAYLYLNNRSPRPIAVKLTWEENVVYGRQRSRSSEIVELPPGGCRQLGPSKGGHQVSVADAWYTGSRN